MKNQKQKNYWKSDAKVPALSHPFGILSLKLIINNLDSQHFNLC